MEVMRGALWRKAFRSLAVALVAVGHAHDEDAPRRLRVEPGKSLNACIVVLQSLSK